MLIHVYAVGNVLVDNEQVIKDHHLLFQALENSDVIKFFHDANSAQEYAKSLSTVEENGQLSNISKSPVVFTVEADSTVHLFGEPVVLTSAYIPSHGTIDIPQITTINFSKFSRLVPKQRLLEFDSLQTVQYNPADDAATKIQARYRTFCVHKKHDSKKEAGSDSKRLLM